MDLRVVIPVGPGHELLAETARESVVQAEQAPHPWDRVSVVLVDDSRGEKGRSWARNEGMEGGDPDWFFFLDADDQMHPLALGRNSDNDATFGAVKFLDGPPVRNYYPRTAAKIGALGIRGTLTMGFFIRADVARALRFREDIDIGEDWEFYSRLISGYSWTKIRKPLALIGYLLPSASGPRGRYELEKDWTTEGAQYLQ